MDTTIKNIKKFLHLGTPKTGKKSEKILNGDALNGQEKPRVNHQTVTTSVEISQEEIMKRNGNGHLNGNGNVKQGVPLAIDDMDGDEDDDTLEKCGGCRKPMKDGHEITLSGGKTFHYSCFQCDICKVDVSQRRYAYEGGLLLCEPCIKSAVRTACHKCILTIEMNDIKLIVDGKEFHQKCFACFNCSIQLDKVYGSKDGEYYCEMCYVQKFGKKCAACGKVILGEGLRFGEDSYHRDCFKCYKCGEKLGQGSAHKIKSKPVCLGCYEKQFLETCFVCLKTVAEGILYKEKRFHQECFKCKTCGLLLADKKGEFLLTEDGLQCKKCIRSIMSDDLQVESVAEICAGCGLPIHVKNLVFDGERNWHHKCFICSQCHSSLVNSKYYDKKGVLYCNYCFLAEHLPTCYACKVEIKGNDRGGGVKLHTDMGQTLTWHRDCLQCSVCQIRVSLENVVFKEKLFCKSCYIETNLNKCDKCSQVITGAGYTFRDKFWHDTCFGCDRCPQIFNDGKFRILREEKLCDNCFKSATHQ